MNLTDYHIVQKKRAGHGGKKQTLGLVRFELVNTLGKCPKNLIEIGSVVPEIWLAKVKSRGHVYLGSHIYSA